MKLLLTLGIFVSLAGCKAVGPDYKSPNFDLPDTYAWADESEMRPPAEPALWWTQFDDETLNYLINTASLENFDVRIAFERISQYRAQLGIATAEIYPDIGALANYSRTRTPQTDYSTPGVLAGGEPYNSYRAGVGGSWEVDLFGKIARTIQVSERQLQATVDDWRWANVTMRADVAAGYITIRTLQSRLSVIDRGIQIERSVVDLLDIQLAQGITTQTLLLEARAKLAEAEATMPSLQMSLANEVAALATLLGMTPELIDEILTTSSGIPVPPSGVAVGVPADLLRRRPDVRAAERALAAATANIGVATADLYPQLSLTGQFGFGASQFNEIFNWASHAYAVGPSLQWDFFNGGRVRSLIKRQESISNMALLQYEETVIQAINEVERTLVSFVLSSQQRDDLHRGATDAASAFSLISQQYEQGVINRITLLNAEQQLLQVEDLLLQTQGLAAESLVNVYRSLGGGWSSHTQPDLPLNKDGLSI